MFRISAQTYCTSKTTNPSGGLNYALSRISSSSNLPILEVSPCGHVCSQGGGFKKKTSPAMCINEFGATSKRADENQSSSASLLEILSSSAAAVRCLLKPGVWHLGVSIKSQQRNDAWAGLGRCQSQPQASTLQSRLLFICTQITLNNAARWESSPPCNSFHTMVFTQSTRESWAVTMVMDVAWRLPWQCVWLPW